MSAQLWHGKALASVRYVRTALARPNHSYRPTHPHGFDTAKPQLSPRYARTARGRDEALASPTRTLDLVCAKAWQTLPTVSPFVPLVRSTKTQLSLSPQLTRIYATKLPTPISTSTLMQCSMQSTYDSLLRTALALQHLAHVRLAVRASNQIDAPPVNPMYCQTGISIYQPRPTSASSYNHPAAFYDSSDLSFQLRSSSCIPRLKLRQLPATNIKLRSSTSQVYQLST